MMGPMPNTSPFIATGPKGPMEQLHPVTQQLLVVRPTVVRNPTTSLYPLDPHLLM